MDNRHWSRAARAVLRRLPVTRFGAAVLIGIGCLVQSTLATAEERYAILIGVSQYPYLKGRDLKGPRNDVRLMYDTLLQKGFDPSHIIVLTDGVPDALNAIAPTRSNILAALDRVIARLQRGDFLYVHFSGHGSQQPEQVPGQESDGLDEIFLARDASGWDGKVGTVVGSITDDEIDSVLRRVASRGANVWAVFDTCHSGTMSRGIGSREEVRQIEGAELGIPARSDRTGTAGTTLDPRLQKPKTLVDREPSAKAVAFFATAPYASTAEYRSSLIGDTYGLFTYVIAEGLRAYPGATYRELGQFIHQRYGALNVSAGGTPFFEGDLDVPVFGDQAVARVRQWPVHADDTSLWIDAGALNLFADGALFAVLRDPRAPASEAVGYARAVDVTAGSSRLVLAEPGNNAPLSNDHGNVRSGMYARLVDPNPEFRIRVSVQLEPDAVGRPTPMSPAVSALLSDIQSAGVRGPRLVWVRDRDDADLELRVTRKSIYVRPKGTPQGTRGPQTTVSVPLPSENVSAEDAGQLREILRKRIACAAGAINLLRVAHQYLLEEGGGKLLVRLFVKRRGSDRAVPLPGSELPELSPGDRLELEVDNAGRDPVEVTVLGVDARYEIQSVFPRAGRSNRIMPGAQREPLRMFVDLNDTAFGVERLVVLASRPPPGRDGGPSDYTQYACENSRSMARGVGGSGDGNDMLDRAIFGDGTTTPATRTRGAGRPSSAMSVQVFSWRTVPRP